MVQKGKPVPNRCGLVQCHEMVMHASAFLVRETQNGLWGNRQIGNILIPRATLFCGLSKESGATNRATDQKMWFCTNK